jgi:hypothetical protein
MSLRRLQQSFRFGRYNKRLEPTRLAPPVYSCATSRAAQAQR